jgi:hypothetical protein
LGLHPSGADGSHADQNQQVNQDGPKIKHNYDSKGMALSPVIFTLNEQFVVVELARPFLAKQTLLVQSTTSLLCYHPPFILLDDNSQ